MVYCKSIGSLQRKSHNCSHSFYHYTQHGNFVEFVYTRMSCIEKDIINTISLIIPFLFRLYLLSKINKKNIPGRPVISSINCHNNKLSQFVDYYIQPLATKVKCYIRDTTDFINRLQNIDYIPHNASLVIFCRKEQDKISS